MANTSTSRKVGQELTLARTMPFCKMVRLLAGASHEDDAWIGRVDESMLARFLCYFRGCGVFVVKVLQNSITCDHETYL
jgi:hypothetical protein